MSTKFNTLLDLEKELRKNFVGLEINFGPTEHHPEWIEVGGEGWGRSTIHINLHPDCVSIFGIVRGEFDSYESRPLPPDPQDYLDQIKAFLEPSISVVVHGPVTVGSIVPPGGWSTREDKNS